MTRDSDYMLTDYDLLKLHLCNLLSNNHNKIIKEEFEKIITNYIFIERYKDLFKGFTYNDYSYAFACAVSLGLLTKISDEPSHYIINFGLNNIEMIYYQYNNKYVEYMKEISNDIIKKPYLQVK